MSWIGSIEHTQGRTWGGSQLDMNLFKAVSVLGGFFGLDHLLLRSPKTGLMKFLVNIITLGFWYLYDIVQTFSDADTLKQYGLTIPLFGPSGIGAGMFHTDGGSRAPETSPTPFTFLAFATLIWLPFGLSYFIAGDTKGGAAKFFMTFSPLFFMGFIWAMYSTFHLISDTPDILTNGTDRFFPASLFMDKHGPAPGIMIPKAEEAPKSAFAEAISSFSFLLGPLEKPFLEAVVGTGEAGIQAAEAAKTAGETLAENMPTQTGGGYDSTTNMIFFGVAGIVLFGSLVLTAVRYSSARKTKTTTNDIPPEASDEPPSGSGVL